jgi:hypothetical protein
MRGLDRNTKSHVRLKFPRVYVQMLGAVNEGGVLEREVHGFAGLQAQRRR